MSGPFDVFRRDTPGPLLSCEQTRQRTHIGNDGGRLAMSEAASVTQLVSARR